MMSGKQRAVNKQRYENSGMKTWIPALQVDLGRTNAVGAAGLAFNKVVEASVA